MTRCLVFLKQRIVRGPREYEISVAHAEPTIPYRGNQSILSTTLLSIETNEVKKSIFV